VSGQTRGRRHGIEDRWTTRTGVPSAAAGQGSRWKARYVAADGKEHSRNFRTRDEAKVWLDGQVSAVHTGKHVAPAAGRVTVRALATDYQAARPFMTPKSQESLRSLLDARLLPRWGDMEVRSIQPEHVQEWVTQLLSEGMSTSRTRQLVNTLGALLQQVVNRDLAANPCAPVRLPKLVTKPKSFLTMGQLLALADACGDDADIVLTLGLLGLRWGELVALKVRSVNFLRKRLSIDASTTEVGGRLVTGLPKTWQRRQVGVPQLLISALSVRCQGKGPDDLLFTTASGTPLRARNWRRDVYDQAAASIGMPGLDLHSLRHTAASLSISSGSSPVEVARQLGHSNASTTLTIYAHWFDSAVDSVAERLDKAAAAVSAADS
jgi:integrase